MKKLVIFLAVLLNVIPTFSAVVIKKEDAPLYKKSSVYAEINVNDDVVSEGGGLRQSDEAINKFSVLTAKKEGSTYTNEWSNYKLTIEDDYLNANDVYDFNADGIRFDFGIHFKDYSRIAIYYSRLSKDLNVIASTFSPGAPITDVVIAGEVYKHVYLEVPYPYGIEKYDYYLRNVDGKLMVIELYYEDGRDTSKDYVEKIERLK